VFLVNSQATFGTSATFNSILTVNGAATLASTLAVTGASTLTGNTSIGGTLTVAGASTFTGAATFNSTLALNGALTVTASSTSSITTSTSTALALISESGSSSTTLAIYQQGTGNILDAYDGVNNVFTIRDGGNIGFSTSTPSYLADIDGSLRVGIQGATSDYLFYANTAANRVGIGTSTPYGFFSINPQGGIPSFVIGSSTTQLIVLDSGRVGIGTTTPESLLAVAGSSYLGGTLSVRDATTLNNTLAVADTATFAANINVNSTTATSTFAHGVSIRGVLGVTSGTFGLGTGSATTTLTSLAGNLGIATANPTFQLDVTGNARFSSLVDASYFVATSTTATSTFAGGLAVDTSDFVVDPDSGRVGIGTASPVSVFHLQSSASSPQITLGYDATNYYTTDISSAGEVAFIAYGGSGAGFLFSDDVNIATTTATQFTTGYDTANYLAFQTNSSGTTTLDVMGGQYASLIVADPLRIATTSAFALEVRDSAGTANLLTVNTSSNRIGVNNASPAFTLDVTGDARFTSLVDASYFVATSTTATSTFAGGLAVDTSDFVVDPDSGRVGIGVITPLGKLQVGDRSSGTGEPTYHGDLIIQGNPVSSESTGGLEFKHYATDSGGGWKLTSVDNTTNDFNIASRQGSAAWTDRVTIQNAGNVGIGTSTPAYLADIDGAFRVGVQGGTTDYLLFANTATNRVGIASSTPWGYLSVNALGGQPALVVGSSTTQFIVDKNGNVGIGSTTPAYKLAVNGNVALGNGSSNANLVTNGSDWTGAIGTTPPTGWTGGGSVGPTWDIVSGGLRLTGGSSGAGSNSLTQSIAVVVGEIYNFSVQLKRGTSGYTTYKLGTTSGGAEYSSNSDYGTSDFTTYTFRFVATAATAYVFIELGAPTAGSQTAFVDEVTLTRESRTFIDGRMLVTAGTALLPSVAETTDYNTGVNWLGSDALALVTGGVSRVHIDSAGLVGIGTTTPQGLLAVEQGTETYSLYIGNQGSSTPSLVVQGVNGNGNVGIGTTAPTNGKLVIIPNTGNYSEQFILSGIAPNSNVDDIILGFNAYGSATAPTRVNTSNSAWTITPRTANNADTNASLYITYQTIAGVNYSPLQISGGLAAANSVIALQQSGGSVGIGTTTPWGLLAVNPNGVSGPEFVVGSSTKTDFIVTNAGNVGIGTTGPTSPLEIKSSISTATLADYPLLYLRSTANGTTNVGPEIILAGDIHGDGTNNANFASIQGIKENASVDNYATALRFGTRINGGSMTEQMRISSSGNVGIGTTAPGSIASWGGDALNTNLNVYDGTNDARMVIQGTTGAHLDLVDLGGGSNDKWLNFIVDAGIGKFGSLQDNAAGWVANNILVMDLGTGNVGIGTTSPASLNARAPILEIASGASDLPGLVLTSGHATYPEDWEILLNAVSTPDNGADFNIYQGTNMYFKIQHDTGNVGIGTTTPDKLLDVAGTLVVDGTYDLYLGNGGLSLSFNRDPDDGSISNGAAHSYQLNHTGLSTTPASDYLAWQVYDEAGVAVTTSALVINGDGNVGIGTTAPGVKVEAKVIADTTNGAVGYMRLTSGGGANQQWGYTLEDNNYGMIRKRDGTGVLRTTLYLQGGGNDAITINSSGQVGILNTSPSQALDVTGNAVISGNVGIGTTTPSALLAVNAPGGTDSFAIGSTTSEILRVDSNYRISLHSDASIRFRNEAGTGHINFVSKNSSDQFVLNSTLNMEQLQAAEDAGAITWFNMPVSSSASDNTPMSITYKIDNNNVFTIFGRADGTGGADSFGVGIGTTTPYAKLSLVENTTSLKDVFAISTSTSGLIFKVDSYGATYADAAYSGAGADYAEYFLTADVDLQAGEVVCVDVTKDNAVKRCARAADGNVMGIVSTKPAIVGNAGKNQDKSRSVIVGMLGQVPAKVSAENGPIRPGDSLTSAALPGYAMAASAGDSTVGVALEGLAQGTGTIKALISRRNKSLTVAEVESAVVERIAAMEIEDEVALLVSDAVKAYNFDPIVAAKITAEVDAVEASFGLALSQKAGELTNLINANKLSFIRESAGQVAIDTALTVTGSLEAKGGFSVPLSGSATATPPAFRVATDGTVTAYRDFIISDGVTATSVKDTLALLTADSITKTNLTVTQDLYVGNSFEVWGASAPSGAQVAGASVQRPVFRIAADGTISVREDLVLNGYEMWRDMPGLVSVFAYDTAADADGGEWITGNRSASWYNEALDATAEACDLNLNDRCGSRSFPSQAIIAATSDTLYIFNAQDGSLWKKITRHAGGSVPATDSISGPDSIPSLRSRMTSSNTSLQNDGDITAITAADGSVYIAQQGTVSVLDFKRDSIALITGLQNDESGGGALGLITSSSITSLSTEAINGKTYLAVAGDAGIDLVNLADETASHYAGAATNAVLAPSGDLYAIATSTLSVFARVHLQDELAPTSSYTATSTEPLVGLRVSADGATAYTAQGSRLIVIPAEAGIQGQSAEAREFEVSDAIISFSVDEQAQVIYAATASGVKALALGDGSVLATYESGEDSNSRAWSAANALSVASITRFGSTHEGELLSDTLVIATPQGLLAQSADYSLRAWQASGDRAGLPARRIGGLRITDEALFSGRIAVTDGQSRPLFAIDEATGNAFIREDITLAGHSNLRAVAGARDAFVYDTAQDADAGTWRASSSSWSGAEGGAIGSGLFPQKAILIAGTDGVSVFDAKDNSLVEALSAVASGHRYLLPLLYQGGGRGVVHQRP
ncbi:MAG: hypothetical protein HYT31_02475, partial [Parcubacteria group bacterium]|nr:hypothetical protein [Parcubacteria group bacterium]